MPRPGFTFVPAEVVVIAALVSRRIAPPEEPVVKPPVVEGANVKLVPVRRTPFDAVYVPVPEN
jgi:hypothetical protein